ncbi:hypothetical protein Gohar_028453 [Gossypium harknessii]|uniref:Uncharacterized protein n=1 Tax=Gossypium harknessii TaxID=34285 RepID=A0A7J9I8U3_9ROSI|nr:hypothetical protein [Gossypium harknessii]
MKFNALTNKVRVQSSYTGDTELLATNFITSMEENNKVWRAQRTSKQSDAVEPIEKQEEASITREDDELDESKYKTVNLSNITKTSWKRRARTFMLNQEKSDNGTRKKETPEEETDRCRMGLVYDERIKRLKQGKEGRENILSEATIDTMVQEDAPQFIGSTAASRQADRIQ